MATSLVLLGTAAGPTPKVGRQAPAQAIVVDGVAYLVDCGNGVAPQLVRAGVPIRSLRAVFVTHHHSDHNADVGTLLLVGWSQLQRPVELVGPPPLRRMVRQFLEMHAEDVAVRVRSEGRTPLRELIADREIDGGGPVHADDLVRVTAAIVDHPPVRPAFGYRFDTADRSIVISGDTTPCDRLVELAAGADVLVHEAMYAPDLGSRVGGYRAPRLIEHLLESHTTAEQAGAIARRAGVRTLVLSHLFPADPSVDDATWAACARTEFDGEIVVGKDLLVV